VVLRRAVGVALEQQGGTLVPERKVRQRHAHRPAAAEVMCEVVVAQLAYQRRQAVALDLVLYEEVRVHA